MEAAAVLTVFEQINAAVQSDALVFEQMGADLFWAVLAGNLFFFLSLLRFCACRQQ